MPPFGPADDAKSIVQENISVNKVMIFSKTTCPYCDKVKELFRSLNVTYQTMELDTMDRGWEIQDALQSLTNQRTVPNIFVNGQHVGGCDAALHLHADGKLMNMLNSDAVTRYQYDLIIIGGGSGGLAASKEAANLGKKVAVCDFVKPSPRGTTWGLGGTCVNVGCIPKKLMHQAALLGHSLEDAKKYGWNLPEKVNHDWITMKEAIQNHIGSLNWGYRVALKDKNVTYVNGFAEFIDSHTIKTVNRRGKESQMTSERFIIATGERPRYPDIPGLREHSITSDDIFSLKHSPGKTLVVGASYVALECAGFLAGMGLEVTVMVRSILLRGFDQDMANKVGEYMENHGVKFIRKAVPTKVEKVGDGEPDILRVSFQRSESNQEGVFECNTLLIATGRDACTQNIGLEKVGVKVNSKNGKIPCVNEQTNIPHIYAIGDVLEGRMELTPVAIQAGKLLARRLYGGSENQCDYVNVPTTVFTPLEYGCCGLSEEDAISQLGEENLEVYHSYYTPLEFTVAQRPENTCYAKLICDKTKNEKVIGFHVLGPNAGEVTQGFALGIKKGATKDDFDATIGIHPTSAEVFTTLRATRRSGEKIEAAGC